MATKETQNSRFRKQLRAEREHRGWSQEQLAKLLSRKGFPFHASTIAKIEAGDRSVGIAEAVAVAELFEVPLDSLLGRKPRAERDLDYVLGALMDAVYTSRTELHRTARSLRDRLEDIPSDFAGHDTSPGMAVKCSVTWTRRERCWASWRTSSLRTWSGEWPRA